MMDSEIRIYPREQGEIQRVQVVRLNHWKELAFLPLSYDPEALDCFARIYKQYLVPACPWLFGTLVMFHIPEAVAVPFQRSTGKYGVVADPLTAAAAALQRGVKMVGKKPVFANGQVKAFWEALESRNCIRIIQGKLPVTQFIPVSDQAGFLTRTEGTAELKVNAPFFIMDSFDCATVYDHVGTTLGLRVSNGVVENPPLFEREALLVNRDGTVTVAKPSLRDMPIRIGRYEFRHGENAAIYSRPEHWITPKKKGYYLVIVGCRVAAVSRSGAVPVPASGVVLYTEDAAGILPGDQVMFGGMEDVAFGMQVGNSILINGKKTEEFHSRFYNIRHLEPVPFPPSLYPMNFRKARAARIALGADRDGKPMLLWAEGAAKIGHTPGKDSCGASLSEMAEICQDVGMFNAINLDGGGSAQLLLKNQRSLCISDRSAEDASETERPIPLGLMVK